MGTVWDSLGQFGTVYRILSKYLIILGQFGTVWDSLGQFGTVWDSLGQFIAFRQNM